MVRKSNSAESESENLVMIKSKSENLVFSEIQSEFESETQPAHNMFRT